MDGWNLWNLFPWLWTSSLSRWELVQQVGRYLLICHNGHQKIDAMFEFYHHNVEFTRIVIALALQIMDFLLIQYDLE